MVTRIGLFAAAILLAGCGGATVEQATATPGVDEAATAAVSAQATADASATEAAEIALAATTNAAALQAIAPTLTAAAGSGLVTTNRGWTIVERDFDGVTMVQVPTGCFVMGLEDGSADVRPSRPICVLTPFWIDKTEVTQAQFTRYNGVRTSPQAFAGDDRPVEQITWNEARDFCASRGARLPTELEWEFAARGPDSLRYPWGNTFIENRVIFARNSQRQTAVAGSRVTGVSWVGALDMAGNVWEWTSSAFAPYPYVADDGREAETGASNMRRVLRGGAWNIEEPGRLTAAVRTARFPVTSDTSTGVRCARTS